MKIKKFIETKEMRQVVPYNPRWPLIYKQVEEYIKNSVPDVSIEHIGSTAVPGLMSKNMVDMLVIASGIDVQSIKKSMINLGFHIRDIWVDTDEKPYVGGSLSYDGQVQDINVHICRINSVTHVQTLWFRDALRSDPQLCRKYEQLKHKAIKNAGTDPKSYNDYKSDFILEVIESQNKTHNSDG